MKVLSAGRNRFHLATPRAGVLRGTSTKTGALTPEQLLRPSIDARFAP